MRKRGRFGSPLCATIALAMAALIGAAGFGSAALAQQAQTAGPVSLGDLFVADNTDLKPGAADKLTEAAARAVDPRADCPKEARFKVVVKQGDPTYQYALGTARRDALKAILLNLGASPGRFVVDDNVEVGGRVDDVRVDYQAIPDREKPKLDTNSVPPKGTKVKPGDKIEVTMVARDDANRWQSGIQSIQLLAESDGNRSVKAEGWRPQPRTCEHAPEPRRLVATYEVPRNPPPVVRLRAIAEDFANHHDTDLGEFPTGDWYGTFGWTHVCTNGGNSDETHGTADLTLDHDGRGNLTGTLTGSTPERKQTIPPCTFAQVAPATFSAKLVGSYTPGQDTFSAQATNVQTRPGRASVSCPAGGGVGEHAIYTVYEDTIFRDAFRDLRRQPDGSRASTGERTHSAGGGTCITNYSLTLRQAQN